MKKVDYDEVAATYDRRYGDGGPADLAAFVRRRSVEAGDRPVLEVGCGTGRWLAEAIAAGHRAVGLDPSPAMLARARQRAPAARIVRGRAESLPFACRRFGAVLCIYVVHHLDDAAGFVAEAARVLDGGGMLSVVALAPHDGRDDWYVYDYFEGTREADCARYPTTAAVEAWLKSAGLADVRIEVAAHIAHHALGTAVLDDPILSRHGTCQLSLLSDAEFERGMGRIREAATRADPASFRTELRLFATVGRKPIGGRTAASNP
jgi:ubiquinone/menaquinone biosynthesis C-methylase UbiE